MANGFESYHSIRKWKDEHISEFLSDTYTLNEFHDLLMKQVFQLAVVRLNRGEPPCSYCFALTGSGGRFEQGFISDQDHGLIFEQTNPEYENYFLDLGSEVSYGLDIVGYPFCKGKVMSSNLMWCKSLEHWKKQLFLWMEERKLDSIRNLQIFYDARCLTGRKTFVEELKSYIFGYQKSHPQLLKRFMESMMHVKNAISPLGQLIVQEIGPHSGTVDLKYSAFIPYVNAIRLLAIKEGIKETSTLERIDRLTHISLYDCDWQTIHTNFRILLDFRLSLSQVDSYEDTHYLHVDSLTRLERKEIKRILKDGRKLHQYVCRLIEKGC
nr:DUF294 nucleotidyltransferase-like domain-containing protein [uncultured Bacillus sp.]